MSKNVALWDISVDGVIVKMTYDDYLETLLWQRKRRYWEYLYGFRCVICNGKFDLMIHHRIYIRLGSEFATDAVPTCTICHHIFHKYSTVHKSFEILNPIAPSVDPLTKYFLSIWGNRCSICNSPNDVMVHFRSSLNKTRSNDAIVLCRDCLELFTAHGRISYELAVSVG